MALGSIFVSVCSQIINSWPNRKLLNYKYQEQIMDIFPYIVMSVLMAGIVYSIELLNLPNLVTIGIQIPVGIIFYIGVSWILKIDSFVYCINILKKYVRRKQWDWIYQ